MSSTFDARFRSATDDGHPLPTDTRTALEAGLDTPLPHLRIHTGPHADRLVRDLGADAVTCGADLIFGDGAYRPDTDAGMRLLAHEAVHSIQQMDGPVGGAPIGDWRVSTPGDPWEREADRLAADVVAGRRPRRTDPSRVGSVTDHRSPQRTLQRHVSFEHRLLGDGPTADLVAISTGGASRSDVLSRQIALLKLWQTNPTSVTEQDVQNLCPWIRTARVGPDNLLATYGELNALPDYLADAETFDAVSGDVLLAILQVIRQEGYNQLTLLLTGQNPNVTFTDAACAPWRLTMLNTLLETQALDTLTFGLGARGEDHYQGLLARNACHFAPFSWYRWQSSHMTARDLAARAHAGNDAALTHQAWMYHGYADHFLQDSFAAGHLVNKTLIMQWFIEWAAGQSLLPVADWNSIKDMTTAKQPSLAGQWLYDPSYQGPSNDPQTAQEAATLVRRILASTVAGEPGNPQAANYQNYLTFLTGAASQLASANLHDYYNANSVWVSSAATPTPYEVWGDDTLFTGANGGKGVQETSGTAQMSQQALLEILGTGSTSISIPDIRQHFPTMAGANASSLQELGAWNEQQKASCMASFGNFGATLKTLLLGLASPRLGVVSQDQTFASVWTTSLPRAGYVPATTLLAGGRMFVGSNGYVYELDPTTGAVLHSLLVTSSVGVGDYNTQLATDGTTLFVGVHGYVYGVRLADWSKTAWNVSVGGTGYEPVAVLVNGSRLFAGSNGYVYEIDPNSGSQKHSLLLASLWGQGDYETRLDCDGSRLYAGAHGYLYGVDLGSFKEKWNVGLGGTGFQTVSPLAAGGKLYAGSNGYVYQIDPSSGSKIHSLLVAGTVGVGDYDTRLATDGRTLFAGTHGYLYGVDLGSWKSTWNVGVGGTGFKSVNVLAQGGRLFAGSNGYAYRVDPASGAIEDSILLTYILGVGDFETRLATDGQDLYAGVHGYESKVLVNDMVLGGTVYHNWLKKSGSWNGWVQDFDGAPTDIGAVTAVMGATGNLEVFGVAADGTLWHDWLTSDGKWHGWSPNFDGAPSDVMSVKAVMGATGNLEVFAITGDGTLWHDWLTGAGDWHGWTKGFDGAPSDVVSVTAAMGPTKNLEVFAVTGDGTLWHDWLTPSGVWNGWTPDFNGAPPNVTAVAAAMGPTGNLEVFAISADGVLSHSYLASGGWQGWTAGFDGAPTDLASISAVMGASGNLEVFAIDTAGTLWHNWLTHQGNWNGWTPNFDGAPANVVTVTAAMGPSGNLETFATDTGGTLWHNYLSSHGNWNGWTPNFDGAPAGVASVAAAKGPTGNLEVFAIRANAT